ncbi:MAG TPA: glycosyltransferase, partial [Thermodesulfobacteriota bacterium]|nr:glycosyltransferase [Thermodesulfobacteriota bacterium]
YRGSLPYGWRVREIYNRGAFVLETRQSTCLTGLTQRIFDGAACGRPVLAEYSPEVEELFDPGDELFCFSDPANALEKRDKILTRPGEAERIARRAQRRVLACHTYRHRARKILELLNRS